MLSSGSFRLLTNHCHRMHDARNDSAEGKDDIESDLLVSIGALRIFVQALDGQGRCDAAECIKLTALALISLDFFTFLLRQRLVGVRGCVGVGG